MISKGEGGKEKAIKLVSQNDVPPGVYRKIGKDAEKIQSHFCTLNISIPWSLFIKLEKPSLLVPSVYSLSK